MLNNSCEKETTVETSTTKTLITSFLPRQLLLNSNKPTNMNPNTNHKKTLTKCDSSQQQRGVLLNSISQFLDKNGFSKTLKRFRKEAHFQEDGGGNCSFDIEEMCFEYLKSREYDTKEEQGTTQKSIASAKKSEKRKENGGNEESKSETTTEDCIVVAADVKSKKKKKAKTANGASEKALEESLTKPAEDPGEITLSLPNEPAEKSKDKKKKLKIESERLGEDLQEKQSEVVIDNLEKKEKKEKKGKKEKNGGKITEENVTVSKCEGKKESKKRKKPSSEVNGSGHVEEATFNDSKRRKTDDSELSNGIAQPLKTPNEFANGNLKKDGREKSQKRDKTAELNDSVEPTSVKAFQRVKPEDIEFADERLQDNSYWAKDGADSGYGAKAQEVLGQVRGRDFRHEKTKKKRGTYRGGLIDLHTHSVKFNYEDDDE